MIMVVATEMMVVAVVVATMATKGDGGSHDDIGVVDDVMVVTFRGNVCVAITNINQLSDLPISQFSPENPLAHAHL